MEKQNNKTSSFVMQTRSKSRKQDKVASIAAQISPPIVKPQGDRLKLVQKSTTPAATDCDNRSAGSVASSSASTSSVSKQRESLPLHVQKQLCEDIEAYGGINHIGQKQHLAYLLNFLVEQFPYKENLYGKPNDSRLRKRIRKKVYLESQK